jgi:bifunctional non-homologous end joining protein LigD
MKQKTRPLSSYRAKRSPERTPEPFGAEGAKAPGLFVVQKHGARRLHYDFRLEMGGVLKSWAVPKGPSLDPADRRLAVAVEDHPVEYADFEGVIPAGNYGAGPVIVWDRGVWVPREDPEEGLASGKLTFDLNGYKLHGLWHLFRMKDSQKEWLLIKKPDGWARPAGAGPPETSILSGQTLDEVRAGSGRAAEIASDLDKLKAPRAPVAAASVKPMLTVAGEKIFSKKGWIFELKYDGYRLIGAREKGRARLFYRRGREATAVFPELARALELLPFGDVVIDGEAVVLDEKGRPNFAALAGRGLLTNRGEIRKAAAAHPATLFVFDLLAFEGFDLRSLPLFKRKEILRRVLPQAGPLRYSDHVEEKGEAFYPEVIKLGLEGTVGKRADSAYRSGRTGDWIKFRADRTGDFAIVGFTEPQGARAGLGALHLAALSGKTLVYAGKVGSGLPEEELPRLRESLEKDRRSSPPVDGKFPTGPETTWVNPRFICEVRFKERTPEGLLRQPVFLRLRPDKPLGEIEEAHRPPAPVPEPPGASRRLELSNLKKIFWPEEGYTKADLLSYYRGIAPWLLPYLKDRPVVLTRYPDGIAGKSFFQKDAPGYIPGWIRTERIWSEHTQREIDYFICDDEETLLYLVNLGTIPLHVWSSRSSSLAKPDWCILDLDPKGAPFSDVVKVARALGALCEELEIPAFVKTSGSTGLHILLPLAAEFAYAESRTLAELLARVIVDSLPDIATLVRNIRSRGGRVYLDYLQNRHGQLLVSPYSARPLPGAPVSTPLRWSEVNAKLNPRQFTIRNVPARARRLKPDPVLAVLEERIDLRRALGKLEEKLARKSPRSRRRAR